MLKRSLACLVVALAVPAGAQAHDHAAEAGAPVSTRLERTLGGDVSVLPSGLYRVRTSSGLKLVTHGPDPKREMLRDENGDGAPDLSNGPERAPSCIADPATDYYQQVLYAYPTTGSNNLATSKAGIQAQIRRNDWLLNDQSLASGGPEADYKVLCEADGSIKVTAFPVVPDSAGDTASFGRIVNSAASAGYTNQHVDYTIFYDGSGGCGFGNVYGDESPGVDNANNTGGDYGVSYRNCWFGLASMHENAHNEGAVQYNAPNSTGNGWHCNELDDVMCYVDGGNLNQEMIPCPVQPGIQHFDCAWNTYFDSAPESGEWLSDHWNIGSNVNRFTVFGSDTRAPSTTITAGPSGLTNDPTFSFESSEDPSTFECSLQQPAQPPSYSPCSSPKTYSGIVDGPYRFDVRAVDPALNVDPSPPSQAFTLDATGPDTRMDSSPAGTIKSTNASFAFSLVRAEPDASFECSLDGATFTRCASPTSLVGLGQGFHLFRVRALDALGNPDPTPATGGFAVDSVRPKTKITSDPVEVLTTRKRARVRFSFKSSEPGSKFECRLDGGRYSACSSPRVYSGLRPGKHWFEVRAIDPVGNLDVSPAADRFRVKREHEQR